MDRPRGPGGWRLPVELSCKTAAQDATRTSASRLPTRPTQIPIYLCSWVRDLLCTILSPTQAHVVTTIIKIQDILWPHSPLSQDHHPGPNPWPPIICSPSLRFVISRMFYKRKLWTDHDSLELHQLACLNNSLVFAASTAPAVDGPQPV